MSFSYRNLTLWPVYITIENLNAEIWQSQKRLEMLFLGSILIVYERLEDANNKDKDLKAKIYYMALKTILQYTYPNIPFISF